LRPRDRRGVPAIPRELAREDATNVPGAEREERRH
jgi:hypothetical protein